jgi:hypothetical protein
VHTLARVLIGHSVACRHTSVIVACADDTLKALFACTLSIYYTSLANCSNDRECDCTLKFNVPVVHVGWHVQY